MYRIRLTSGEEAVYRSTEELALAISTGVVDPGAEVFHKAGNCWLPIKTHPDYRVMISGKQSAIPAPLPPLSRSGRRPAVPANPAPRTTRPVAAMPADSSVIEPAAVELPAVPSYPVVHPELAPEAEMMSLDELPLETTAPAQVASSDHPHRSRAKQLRIMLSLAMSLTILGGTGVILHRLLGALRHGSAPQQVSEGMPPAPIPDTTAEETVTPASATAVAAGESSQPGQPALDTVSLVYPAPSKPLGPLAGAAPTARSEPRVVSRLRGMVNRMPSYSEAYADARAEMDEALTYVSFRRVFDPVRFGSQDSLRAARRMVVAAGNILRVYRGREVMLEQTYRPDEPEGNGSFREPFESAEASRALLADVDSLYGLLVAQSGEFTLRGDLLAFRSRRAAGAYTQLRRSILRTLAVWRDSSAAVNRVTIPRLLRAVGPTLPPPIR
jgi:hypothetical protein